MNETNKSVLLAKEISKSYTTEKNETFMVLENLNFSLQKGEIVAITGESGSGKSTLLHILAGLDSIDSGEIYLHQNRIDTASESNLAKLRNKHLGYVFQSFNLLPDFTALENVMIPALVYNKNWGEVRSKAELLLKRVGVLERASHKIGEMSGGEIQRVTVARSLICDPDIILADEPTGNLDENNSDIVFELLREMCQEKEVSILVVTHSKTLAKRCETQYLLQNKMLERV